VTKFLGTKARQLGENHLVEQSQAVSCMPPKYKNIYLTTETYKLKIYIFLVSKLTIQTGQ
jgi:hypothetical protein